MKHPVIEVAQCAVLSLLSLTAMAASEEFPVSLPPGAPSLSPQTPIPAQPTVILPVPPRLGGAPTSAGSTAPAYDAPAAPLDSVPTRPGKSLPSPADKFFDVPTVPLTTRDRAALAIAQRSQSASAVQPVAGAHGAIQFPFGASQPNIVCAVLQVCDVALQGGEQLNSIHLGDTARWLVEPAASGAGPTESTHLIIKPLDVGLDTSLVVTTSRRTYHLRLRSTRNDFMPMVQFSYPEEIAAKWEAVRKQEVKDQREATIPKTGEHLGALNFDYSLSGTAAWKPVRVYNDGTRTLIQMPNAMAQTEAPTLLVLRKEGGLFTDDETVMVNYRIQGDRYIVDTVFDKAILIAGVGSSQDRVTIRRGK